MALSYRIRPVEIQDNPALTHLIVTVLAEFGCSGPGFACNDPETQDMYTTYQAEGAAYWVIEETETANILGGGGFSRLKGTTPAEAICELQKLYFYPQTRGLGLGKKMMQLIIEESRQRGYREMYLETIPQMVQAIELYKKFGFEFLPGPKGNTGHFQCPVHMSLPLLTTEEPPREYNSPLCSER